MKIAKYKAPTNTIHFPENLKPTTCRIITNSYLEKTPHGVVKIEFQQILKGK
jgi:hypothetical protein